MLIEILLLNTGLKAARAERAVTGNTAIPHQPQPQARLVDLGNGNSVSLTSPGLDNFLKTMPVGGGGDIVLVDVPLNQPSQQ